MEASPLKKQRIRGTCRRRPPLLRTRGYPDASAGFNRSRARVSAQPFSADRRPFPSRQGTCTLQHWLGICLPASDVPAEPLRPPLFSGHFRAACTVRRGPTRSDPGLRSKYAWSPARLARSTARRVHIPMISTRHVTPTQRLRQRPPASMRRPATRRSISLRRSRARTMKCCILYTTQKRWWRKRGCTRRPAEHGRGTASG